MANTHYDSDNSTDSNIQLINSQMRVEEITSGCNELINEYLSVLQRKDFIRYYKEQGLYIPTDTGMHFLKIYNTLASLLI
jgi:predicted transcriptional regulator